MQSNDSISLADRFFLIAESLHAVPGDSDYHYGVFDHVAFLVKLETIDPPSLKFKLRMKAPLSGSSDWAENISKQYEDTIISCEIRDDYITLFIFLVDTLDHESIVEIVRSCIRRHSKLLPTDPGYCYGCRASGDAMMIQSNDDVSTLCLKCRNARYLLESQKIFTVDRPRESFTALIPVAILISSVGWAGIWIIYDWVFSGARNEIFLVPAVGILILIFFIGYCLGLPVGKILLKSGFSKYVSRYWVSIVVTILTVLAGEIIATSYLVFRKTGAIDPLLVLSYLSLMFFRGNIFYALLKTAFGVSLGTAIYQISDSQKTKPTS